MGEGTPGHGSKQDSRLYTSMALSQTALDWALSGLDPYFPAVAVSGDHLQSF